MKSIFFSIVMVTLLTLTACASPTSVSPTQLSSSDQVATVVAATMKALTPTPASTTASAQGSVIVAFVKDGNLQVWDETTKQSKTIFTSGDVTTVTASDDGQVIAFLRRSFFVEPNVWEQFALWAVDPDGKNPRELVSAESVRKRINPNEGDSTGIGELKWIPDTHRILYNVSKYFLPGQGITFSPDIYVIDVDTLSDSVLVSSVIPADRVIKRIKNLPSPNGGQLALITATDLSFINADGSNRRMAVLTYPEVGAGDAGPVLPVGVWTQDSSAFVITGSFERDAQFNINFTIWRVPVSGSSLESLVVVSKSHPASVTFSPDGRSMAYVAAEGGWLITPLAGNVGPLATSRDYEGGSYANVHWSPAGKAYTLNLLELCPNATKDSEVCETPLNYFTGEIATIHWIDESRFLFVTMNPPVLFLGRINPPPWGGTAIPIVAWSNQEISRSFALLAVR